MTFLSTFSNTRRILSPILQAASVALLATIPISLAVLGALLTLNPIVIALTAIPAVMASIAFPWAFGRPLGKLLSYPISFVIATPLFALTTGIAFLLSPITHLLKKIEKPDLAPQNSKNNNAAPLSDATTIFQPAVKTDSAPVQSLYPNINDFENELSNTQTNTQISQPIDGRNLSPTYQ